MSDFEFVLVEKVGFNFQETVFEFVFSGARGPQGPPGTIGTLDLLTNKPVVIPADLALTGDSAASFANKNSTWQQIIDSVLKINFRSIFGQYDTRTDLTATDASTMTLDYSLGNAFKIDASAMGAGESFTVTVSNIPTGAVYSALTLLLVTGANLPTVSYTNLSANVADPVIEASLQNELIGRSYDNGTTWVWTVGESF